ncbi:probable serine/threonine-protein kinase DDB_G0284251 [Penaeus chinensis]|uniref:probable serine/threonine-protein kinase DDB_G0284251 n=1 Tax=Penaeus chinensis TaxID=139456 RepID=UPI001FB79565|nr:probable serine/threonine-protein kinase DDB_G0284251 [Penaeus chinensis]
MGACEPEDMFPSKTPVLSPEAKASLYGDHERKVGEGLAGVVYLTKFEGEEVVFKECKGRAAFAIHEAEQDALEALEGVDGVPRILGVSYDQPLILLMSFCGEKTLKDVISGPKLPDSIYLSLLRSLATTLSGIHARNYVHNDLKTDNIVVDRDPPDEGARAYIIDFGLSRQVGEILVTNAIRYDYHENLFWMPPENFQMKSCATAGDLWSLGYVVREVLREVQWDRYPKCLDTVVDKCMVIDPSQRMAIPEVIIYIDDAAGTMNNVD